jgi:uncharacterized membrane protein
MAKEVAQAPGDSLIGALRNSPATKALTEQAKGLVQAQASRVVDKVGDRIAGTADKLTKVGESGELPPIGEGAKRLLHGDSPVKAAAGAAKSSLGQKAGGLLDKIKGKGKGSGQAKAFNIEETIDVGVPVATAYNQWSQFKDFSRFMKGVESVEQASETETNWRVKVFKSRRTWKAKIQEQIPDERIVWTSEGAKGSTKGVVTFHPLGDNLTRILLVIEYYPSGFFEKTGSLWRAAGRRARLDLKNFRRFVMMEGEATGEWRGEIRDGEVVDTGEDATDSQEDDEDATESQEEKPRRRRRASGSAESSAERRPSSSEAGRQRKPSARAAKAESSSEGTRRKSGATRQTRDGARSTRASASSGNGTRRASGTRSASASNGGRGRRATKATKTTASTRSRAGSRSS